MFEIGKYVFWKRTLRPALSFGPINSLKELARALAINPRLASAYYGRGVVWCDRDDLERALSEFNRALELDPQMIAGYANRGLALLRQGKDGCNFVLM